MPSERPTDAAARALSAPWERFHSALAKAVEDVRSYLRAHRNGSDDQAAGRAALGTFAHGRIDPTRFAALIGRDEEIDAPTLSRMSRAFESLSALASRADGPLRIELEPGGDLRTAVARALDSVGRAFGAARVAQLSRTGRYDHAAHGGLLDGIPFPSWNAGERNLAPPVVVELDGADITAGDLAAFLDGATKIVLVARGPMPAAPLVRLITPGTYVLQTADVADLAGLAKAAGPGVAAVVSEDEARFVHDPAGGSLLSERLTVEHVPDAAPRRALGGISAWQQTEDLRQLAVLAIAASPPAAAAPVAVAVAAAGSDPAPAATPSADDPAGKLAAWLLQQADLPGNG